MKRLVCVLLAVVLLGAGCTAEGFVKTSYSRAFEMHDDMPVRVLLPGGEKQGLLHIATGRWVIPPRFEEVKRFSTIISMGNDYLDDVAAVKVDGLWGIIDNEGNLLVEPQYSAIYYHGEGLLLVVAGGVVYEGGAVQGGKWGVLDRQGRVLIAPRFDFIGDFADGMAEVRETGKYGYIDKAGKLAIPPHYDHTWGFRDGLAVAKINGKYGYIDKTGAVVIEPQYEARGVMLFSEGLAAVKVGDKWGYIDKTGTMVIAPQFSEVGYFVGGLAAVRPVGRAGVINRAGQIVVEPIFDEVAPARGAPTLGIVYNINSTDINLSTVRCVFVAESGQSITPWFTDAGEFQEGIAKVRVDGKYGFIDTTGKMVIEPQFSLVSRHCQNGIVFVELDGKRGFRDKEGRWLAQPVFGRFSDYIRKHKVVWDEGYIYDGDGNKLDHYANHMKDGYKYLESQSLIDAAAAFRAALRINPDDEAALYGLSLARES